MSEQLGLFKPLQDVPARDDRDAYAADFDRANPELLELLARLTRRTRARAGTRRIGFRMVWEYARWMYHVHAGDGSAYKLNNNLQAWYARELMAAIPNWTASFICAAMEHQQHERVVSAVRRLRRGRTERQDGRASARLRGGAARAAHPVFGARIRARRVCANGGSQRMKPWAARAVRWCLVGAIAYYSRENWLVVLLAIAASMPYVARVDTSALRVRDVVQITVAGDSKTVSA